MKKLNLFFALSIGALFMASCSTNAKTEVKPESTEVAAAKEAEQTFTIDTENSTVTWKGTMVGVYSHDGNVKLSEGTITVKGNEITAGNFTVDLKTITPTDKNYDASKKQTPEMLVGHLASPDFFDVATYPTANFVVNNAGNTNVTGNLTVRGKTNSETVKITSISTEGGKLNATGTITFDRKKYDVAWDSPMKDMVLSNDIEMTFTLVSI